MTWISEDYVATYGIEAALDDQALCDHLDTVETRDGIDPDLEEDADWMDAA